MTRTQLALFLATVLVLGFFFSVQLRSQAAADRLLSGQDNVTLGLLISGLAQSNQRLIEARSDLSGEEQRLADSASSPTKASQELQQQLSQLQVVNGTVPVHGPGVHLKVSFKMQAFEIQDLSNAMRQLGAEALVFVVLAQDQVAICASGCHSAAQALLAAKANVSYVAPAVGPLDAVGSIGMDLVEQIIRIYDNYGFQTQILVADVRNAVHVLDAALMGADVATVPLDVLEQLYRHPLTDELLAGRREEP